MNHGTSRHDDADNRTAKLTAYLPESLMARLDAYRRIRRWSRSTAAQELIERALSASQPDGSASQEP